MIAYIIISYVLVILFHIKRGISEDPIDIMYIPITSALAPVSLPVIVVGELIQWSVIKPR